MILVSGGQTGVDRAAWDAARASGLKQNGYVPKGRLAEDGTIPARYECMETAGSDYVERTERNVLFADGTLILCFGPPSGGTDFTIGLCRKHGRPHLVLDLDVSDDRDSLKQTRSFLSALNPSTLNVAGPRASFRADVYPRALAFLTKLFS